MRYLTRLTAIVSLGFLPGSISLGAQSADPPPRPSTSVGAKMNVACPVSLRAQHGADGNIRKVDKSRPEGVAQLLHLIITSTDSRQVVEARLRVSGTSGRGRVARSEAATAGAATAAGMDAVRNLTVRFTPGADKEATADAWVPGLTAVLQVELNSVTFADGGTQMFGAADGCYFTPEHFMLIADK